MKEAINSLINFFSGKDKEQPIKEEPIKTGIIKTERNPFKKEGPFSGGLQKCDGEKNIIREDPFFRNKDGVALCTK
ncbi:hypothetical protein HY750_01890 [Candidatus Kuenenbacteria bacterium]|nr:hypothetical protein [Candidatus Kuenenbacteria bacterium]